MGNASYTKQIISNENIVGNGSDSYVYVKHPSGLDIYIWKKEGFTTTEALFGTKYGSVNNRFKTAGDEEYTQVPEGIAHFLEHKLFENEDCDVFELYAKTGAMGNAYTSFDQTVYQFSCTSNYADSLRILLSFVQKPYFTKETVDKEQGIIGQEIKMCEDNPDRQSFFNLLRCLYVNHPVKIDIAGTVESIAHITPELLYKCYGVFYNLNNMVLSIAGNLDVDEVLKICDEELIPAKDMQLIADFPNEPEQVNCEEITEEFPVGLSVFNIGYKCKPLSGIEAAKKCYEAEILLKMIAGPTSKLYNDMMQDGLINSSFAYEVFEGNGFFCNIFSGESKEPKEVKRRIDSEIARLAKEGLDKEQFETIKKARYGSFIKSFDKIDICADLMLNAAFEGVGVFDYIKIFADISFEDITANLKQLFDVTKSAISIAAPISQQQNSKA